MSLWVVLVVGCGLGPGVRGSGHSVEEERQTPDFVVLEVSDGIDATVVVDPTRSRQVRLVGDDNLVALVRTELEGANTLRVFFRLEEVGHWSSPNPLRVEVTVPRLEALGRSGGSTVDLSGTITSESFSLTASGGGTVRARGLATGTLFLHASGGTDVTLSGQAHRVQSELSGGGTLRAREFSAREATLESSGGGETVMRVSESLRVEASGGGEVHIVGRPAVHAQDLSGGSTLTFE
jgi:hypothetical protein